MNIEVQWFLQGVWRQYKVKKIHLKLQGITILKNAWKRVENSRICAGGAASCTHVPLRMRHHSLLPQAPLHTKSCTMHMDTCRECCLLVYQAIFCGKTLFSLS